MQAEVVYNMATSLLDAVATGLTTAGLDEPCRMGVVPGGQIADDWCCQIEDTDEEDGCGGQLAAAFSRIFPGHEPWPNGAPLAREHCPSGSPTVDLLVRLTLCVAVGTDDDPIPSASALDASGSEVMTAAYAMLCAAIGWGQTWPERSLIRGVTPSGPQGGCLGLDLTVTAEIADPPETDEEEPP